MRDPPKKPTTQAHLPVPAERVPEGAAPAVDKADGRRQWPQRLTSGGRVVFASLDQAKAALPEAVRNRLGWGAFVSSIRRVGDDALSAKIGASGSYLYWDRDEPILKHMKYPAVWTLAVERSGQKYAADFPSYVDFIEKARHSRNDNFQVLEQRLLNTIHAKLVRISTVRNTLTPIATLLGRVRADGAVKVADFYASRRRRQQAERYVEFLEGLGFITTKGPEIHQGPELDKYNVESDSSPEDVSTLILADVLRRGHDYLTSYLHLSGLLPFLRVSNSYYTPSAQVHERLAVSVEHLNLFHSYIYGAKKPILQFAHQVDEAVEAGILAREEESKLVLGRTGIMNNYLDATAGVAA